jgi:acetyl esterase/lipase
MLPVRVYRSNEIESTTRFPVYIFFHGGGYMFGTVSSEDATCSRIAAAVRIVVVHVCYRHTPQFKYPKPYHDAWDAFEWVVQHVGELGGDGSKMIAGGISSGGGLAASIVLKDHIKRMSDGGISPRRILGQILMIPSLIPPDTYPFYLLASTEISSYQQNISSPILPTYQRDMFHAYLDAKNHSETPFGLWSKGPLGLEGMPKTTIVAAGMDSLRDEALLYAEMLEEKE